MLTRLIATTVLTLPLLLSACANDPVMAPYGGQADLLPSQEYPQIAVEKDLAKFLAFDRPNEQRKVTVPNNKGEPTAVVRPLSVVVPTRLLSDGGIRVQYRFIFIDESGRQLKPVPDWRYMVLQPRVQAPMEAAALDTAAVDWRLEVRSAR